MYRFLQARSRRKTLCCSLASTTIGKLLELLGIIIGGDGGIFLLGKKIGSPPFFLRSLPIQKSPVLFHPMFIFGDICAYYYYSYRKENCLTALACFTASYCIRKQVTGSIQNATTKVMFSCRGLVIPLLKRNVTTIVNKQQTILGSSVRRPTATVWCNAAVNSHWFVSRSLVSSI